MPGALLPLDTDLWNGDRTRFTILFDPGRVKRGILPNRDDGPAAAGRATTFTLVVSRDWPDAHGQPLASEFRKDYRVGPADRTAARRPRSLAHRAAGGRLARAAPRHLPRRARSRPGAARAAPSLARRRPPIAGDVTVEHGETGWRFVPREPWRAGDYAVSVLPALEDPTGNRIGQAFETLDADDDTPARVPFTFADGPPAASARSYRPNSSRITISSLGPRYARPHVLQPRTTVTVQPTIRLERIVDR